jgi:hypothetical protein
MKKPMEYKSVTVAVIFLVTFVSSIQAQQANEPNNVEETLLRILARLNNAENNDANSLKVPDPAEKEQPEQEQPEQEQPEQEELELEDESENLLKGMVRFRYGYNFVNKDAGRFREDQWKTDDGTGGLDWLHLETTEPDKNGYEWLIEGRAIYDYDYSFHSLMKKEDDHYLKLDFTGFRRYYDGSNEFWDPSLYSLSKTFAEFPDGDLYVDRRRYNIEFGLTPPDGLEVIFGWNRLEKDGKEVLLYGGQATDAGLPNFYGIPPIANLKGTTDTIYGEIAHTFGEKYNFRARQEFEQFHDDKRIEFSSFDSDVVTSETFLDDPGYTNWRTMLMFDSFLDDETYLTTNYMYNYLNGDSTRNVVRPLLAPSSFVTNNRVGSSERTNAGAIGYQKANIVPNLDFTLAAGIKDSRTSSLSTGLMSGSPFTDTSSLHHTGVTETLRLDYKGIEKTVLSFDADLEQRYLDWKQNDDGERWNADIDYTDQVYTFKAVHRFNRDVKSTFKFGIKDLERSYTNRLDDTVGYPGFIQNYRITGDDVMLKTDWRINRNANATLKYHFLQEDIDTGIGGETQSRDIHRGAGSISLSPSSNLFLVTTFMLENYVLKTPASGDATNMFAPGTTPYDFRGNYFSILLDGTYAFNSKTSCTFGYQHTEALGTVDYAGDYAFDKVGLTLKNKVTRNQIVTAGYYFLNFNNHPGGSFDDYEAHYMLFTYTFLF